jgi:hypothetical protein
VTKKKSDTKHTDNLDTEILSGTAAELRTRSNACKIAGGTSACHKLAAAADLLDPGGTEAAPTRFTPATARTVGKSSKARKPAAATLADPGDTDEDDDLEALEDDGEDDLDDDDGDDQE